jgi:hypothetical protein
MHRNTIRIITGGVIALLVWSCGPSDEEVRAEFAEPYKAFQERLITLRKSVPYPGWRRGPGKLVPAPDYGFAEKPGNVIVLMHLDLAGLSAEPAAMNDEAEQSKTKEDAEPSDVRREVAREIWGRLDHERDIESVNFMGYGDGDAGRYFGSYRQQFLQETLDAKYLLMPRVRAYRKPKAMDTENFRGGRLIVDVYLADLEQERWVGGFTVNVENSYYVNYSYSQTAIEEERIASFQRALEFNLVSKFPGAIKDQLVKQWGFQAPPKPAAENESSEAK